jgi:hypothetical protein
MACKHWQSDARDAPPGAISSDGLGWGVVTYALRIMHLAHLMSDVHVGASQMSNVGVGAKAKTYQSGSDGPGPPSD